MALLKYKAGLRPSPRPPILTFKSYLVGGVLPPIPATFDRSGLFPPRTPNDPYPLGMLGNNKVGDCTIAGAGHIVMLWNKLTGRPVQITTADALDDYRDCCGWQGTEATDNGGDMLSVAAYWQRTGFRDATIMPDGTPRRHKIAAYVSIDPNNIAYLIAASYICDGGVGLGVALTEDSERQFDAGEPWSGKAANDDNFHYVPLAYVGNDGMPHVYTWGADFPVTREFIQDNCREAMGYVSEEALRSGKTVEGFLLQDLLADVQQFSS